MPGSRHAALENAKEQCEIACELHDSQRNGPATHRLMIAQTLATIAIAEELRELNSRLNRLTKMGYLKVWNQNWG